MHSLQTLKQPSPGTWTITTTAILALVSVIIGWRPLLLTSELALRDERYTHVLLILPFVAMLIYLDRQLLNGSSSLQFSWVWFTVYLALIATVVNARVSSDSDVELSSAMLALVLSWIVIFLLSYGISATRRFAFPLFLLLGLVPLPLGVLDHLVKWLQGASADAAVALFSVAGVPAMQNGVILTVPGLTIEVAKECSSIRSSSMLLLTSMILAQIMLKSPWRKAMVVAIAVPVSVAKNGLRIFTIVILGTRVSPIFITGSFHHQGGIIFFAIALIMILLLIAALRRRETHPAAFLPNPEPVSSS